MIPSIKNKFPPASILNIALIVPGEGDQTELTPALIDTGSDFTLVPEKWLRSRPASWNAARADFSWIGPAWL
jgi:hypothetical protein